jgi:hypothetical protein
LTFAETVEKFRVCDGGCSCVTADDRDDFIESCPIPSGLGLISRQLTKATLCCRIVPNATRHQRPAYEPAVNTQSICPAGRPRKMSEYADPFGLADCESELEELHEEYQQLYFGNTPFNVSALNQRTYLIIGRRGAGKTALSHYF